MTKPYRSVPHLRAGLRQRLHAYQAITRYFREWPTIETLMYALHPMLPPSRTATMHSVIGYLLEQLGTTPARVYAPPRRVLRLANDPQATSQRLAGVRYWLDQWTTIEPLVRQLDMPISDAVLVAFRDLTHAVGNELVATVNMHRLLAGSPRHVHSA